MKKRTIQPRTKLWIHLSVIFLLLPTLTFAEVQLKKNTVLMGSTFDITVVGKDSAQAQSFINKAIGEISRIEDLISEWKPGTEIYEVNENAGIKPVKVSREVFNLTKDAISFSKLTDGLFDISIAAIDKVWRFDGSMEQMPTDNEIKHSIEKVGYKNILLDSIHSTIFLKNKGMKIGFGSIGKGYAADKGRELLKSLGAKAGIVNASGDLSTWGTPLDDKFWRIGIMNPFVTYKTFKVLKMTEASVTTSGDYEKFVEFNGKRYSHIINPKTGFPASGLTSVTVFGSSAEVANGLSTSIMLLGKDEAKLLLKKFPNYGALLISDKGKTYKIQWEKKLLNR